MKARDGVKTCSLCKRTATLDEFCRSAQSPDGRHGWCKTCSRLDGRRRRDSWTPAQRRAEKARSLWRKYRMSLDEWERRLAAQDDVCAICRRPETRVVRGVEQTLAVDHDHITGVVRGLLCGACNTAIGKFDDDTDRLRAAIAYLDGYAQKAEEER